MHVCFISSTFLSNLLIFLHFGSNSIFIVVQFVISYHYYHYDFETVIAMSKKGTLRLHLIACLSNQRTFLFYYTVVHCTVPYRTD